MNPRLDTMIVDDSKASIAVLQGDLQRHECINVVATTTDISKAGELLGIQLLDHVIIGDRCYSSLRERGILSDKG